MMNMLGEQGLAHTRSILTDQGRIRFLKDWDSQITTHIKGLRIRPGSEPVIERINSDGETESMILTVTRVEGAKSRRFDYDALKQDWPTLYQSSVTLTAADSPLTLTFPRTSAWNELRSQGWQSAAVHWQDAKRHSTARLQSEAEILSEIRAALRELEAREKTERLGLAELIMTRNRVITPYSYRGSILRVSESRPRRSIDLDAAARHRVLSRYLRWGDVKPYTKVWFKKVTEDD